MKPIKILSIDFDYFIDTDITTRNDIFPDGADEMPLEELSSKWVDVYKNYPFVEAIGVTKEYDQIKELLSDPKFVLGKNVLVNESHKEIYMLIQAFKNEAPLEVYNIDFHHDMYHYRIPNGDRVNCSNWARIMLEEYPNANYKWIRREDSEIYTLFGEVECEHTTKLEGLYDIDFIFICESPEWTPPHLHNKYLDLIKMTIKD